MSMMLFESYAANTQDAKIIGNLAVNNVPPPGVEPG